MSLPQSDENALLQPDVDEKNPFPKSKKIGIACILVLLLFVAGTILGYCLGKKSAPGGRNEPTHRCYLKHEDMKETLSSPRLLVELHGAYLREIPSRPLNWLRSLYEQQVYSGSSADETVVAGIVKHLRRLGVFDEIQVENYTALISLPDPEGSLIQVLNRTDNQVLYRERIIANIPNEVPSTVHHKHHTKHENIAQSHIQPFVAYSKPGTVQGELVNINFGLEADFKSLEDANVVLNNRIGLMKKDDSQATIEPLVNKISRAKAYNLSAILVYTDSVNCDNTTHYESLNQFGDPQTPGYASVDGVWRKPINDTEFIDIPVQTVSCQTARSLLQRITGQIAPKQWQGKYNGTLYMGRKSTKPDSWFVQLDTSNHFVEQKIQNILATIRGFINPRQVIMLGASRNSFQSGQHQAVTATETLMNIAHPLQYLINEKKWLPRRSITFCFWGGAEFSNIGRTEFMEKYASSLDDVIAYIDVDNQPMATNLAMISSTSLSSFVASTVAMRVSTLSDMDSYYRDYYYYSDDEEQASGSHVLDSVADQLSEMKYLDPEQLPSLQWCHVPIIQVSVRNQGSEPLDVDFLQTEIKRLKALLMLSLADQIVIQYDNMKTAKAIRLAIHRLVLVAHQLPEHMKVALEARSRILSLSASHFDHLIDNQIDYSNEDFVSSVNVVLTQLNKILGEIRTKTTELLSSLPDVRHLNELIISDDVPTDYSAATLQDFSKLIVLLENANNLMKTVHFHVMGNDSINKTLDISNETLTDLERGWV